MGPRPSPRHTIERINNDGDYEPENCRWATRAEQLRNTRRNRFVSFNGVTQCIAEWATQLGMPYKTLQNRLKRGWSVKDALTTPRVTSKDSRGARKITFRGKTLCLAEWAREIGVARATLGERLAHWPLADALTSPLNSTRKRRG